MKGEARNALTLREDWRESGEGRRGRACPPKGERVDDCTGDASLLGASCEPLGARAAPTRSSLLFTPAGGVARCGGDACAPTVLFPTWGFLLMCAARGGGRRGALNAQGDPYPYPVPYAHPLAAMFARSLRVACGAAGPACARVAVTSVPSVAWRAGAVWLSTLGAAVDANVAVRPNREVFKSVQQGLDWDAKEVQVCVYV